MHDAHRSRDAKFSVTASVLFFPTAHYYQPLKKPSEEPFLKKQLNTLTTFRQKSLSLQPIKDYCKLKNT